MSSTQHAGTAAMTGLLLRLLLLLAAADAALRKCCARRELLAWDSAQQGFACRAQPDDVSGEEGDMIRDALAWLPRDVVRFQADRSEGEPVDADRVNAFLLGADVQFGAQPACAAGARDVLVHYAGAEREEYSLVAMQDGQVTLEVLKESSLHNPSVAHAQLFPGAAWCVDAGSDAAHLVLLCPCSAQLPCVRKCCADSFALDEAAQPNPRCAAVAQLPYTVYDWLPGIANDTAEVVRYYRLTQAQPPCAAKQLHVIKNKVHEEAKFYLLPGGSIKAVDDGHVYPTDSFCGEFTVRNDEAVYFCPAPGPAPSAAPDDVMAERMRAALLAVGACAVAAAAALLVALPDKPRSVFGCALSAHAAMLALGHAAHAALELVAAAHAPYAATLALGLGVQFGSVSASLWLLALSLDVAFTFGGGPGSSPLLPSSHLLLGYGVLAWGGAALTTLATAFVEISPTVTAVKPRFGQPMAFFNGRGATWAWLYGPIGAAVAASAGLAIYAAVGVRGGQHRRIPPPPAAARSNNPINKLSVGAWLVTLGSVTCALELASFAASDASAHWLRADVVALVRGVAVLCVVCRDRRAICALRRALATLHSSRDKMADKMAACGFVHSRLELQDLPPDDE